MEIIKKLVDLLSPAEHKSAGMLMAMILVMAFIDTLGVASILPFIAVLSNPSLVETNPILFKAYQFSESLGVSSINQFLFLFGFFVFVLLVFSLAVKALTTYAQTRFALMREYSIGKRLVEGYLHQPYCWFLNRHSSDLGKTILSEVHSVIYNGFLPLMALLAQSAVAIALLILLLLVDPLLAIAVSLILGLAYGSILLVMGGWLNKLGQARILANQERYSVVGEAFGAVKEIKASGLEAAYVQRFAKPAIIYATGQATAQVIAQTPRFVLEAIAFGGMLLVILYLLIEDGSFQVALPMIALYAFAGYRLMPALQQIYSAITQLKYVDPALKVLHSDLFSLNVVQSNNNFIEPISLKESIELKNIFFKYPNTKIPSLNGIDITIPSRSTVGLVGFTGSGKTTTVDLILGLIEPQSGEIYFDGQVVDENNRRRWRKSFGYVPQNIYLADDTICANIAFGVDPKLIDFQAVERASRIANLHNFVVKNLPRGYNTKVGERGVCLSGGQRQRIGIARALYHNPSVLIMDEATSALDSLTEQVVMEAVQNLNHSLTIILIAHRLTTVRECNQIFLLDNGFVQARGTYDELFANCDQFRAMTLSQ